MRIIERLRNFMNFNKIVYISVMLLSAAFLFFGNRMSATNVINIIPMFGQMPVYTAQVTEIVERAEHTGAWTWGTYITNIHIFFYARMTSGDFRNEIVLAEFADSFFFEQHRKEVEVGDRVLLSHSEQWDFFRFVDYERMSSIIVLGIILFGMVLLFSRKKGFNSVIALAFTCIAIFAVFIPAILSGRNIYIAAAIICAFSIISTLLIVVGPNKKTLSTMLGCLGGVILAGLLMFAMDYILNLSGLIDQEAGSLLRLPTPNPINLRAILFAGVIIGSTGAIMDVAMSISSSLWEVKQAGGASDFRSIFKSGVEIGKDIFGTMLNTLILAYIGSSLSVILLLTAHTTSLLTLFNTEMIIVEFLRALVGSFGMFLAIPLTAAVCGWLYSNKVAKASR